MCIYKRWMEGKQARKKNKEMIFFLSFSEWRKEEN